MQCPSAAQKASVAWDRPYVLGYLLSIPDVTIIDLTAFGEYIKASAIFTGFNHPQALVNAGAALTGNTGATE